MSSQFLNQLKDSGPAIPSYKSLIMKQFVLDLDTKISSTKQTVSNLKRQVNKVKNLSPRKIPLVRKKSSSFHNIFERHQAKEQEKNGSSNNLKSSKFKSHDNFLRQEDNDLPAVANFDSIINQQDMLLSINSDTESCIYEEMKLINGFKSPRTSGYGTLAQSSVNLTGNYSQKERKFDFELKEDLPQFCQPRHKSRTSCLRKLSAKPSCLEIAEPLGLDDYRSVTTCETSHKSSYLCNPLKMQKTRSSKIFTKAKAVVTYKVPKEPEICLPDMKRTCSYQSQVTSVGYSRYSSVTKTTLESEVENHFKNNNPVPQTQDLSKQGYVSSSNESYGSGNYRQNKFVARLNQNPDLNMLSPGQPRRKSLTTKIKKIQALSFEDLLQTRSVSVGPTSYPYRNKEFEKNFKYKVKDRQSVYEVPDDTVFTGNIVDLKEKSESCDQRETLPMIYQENEMKKLEDFEISQPMAENSVKSVVPTPVFNPLVNRNQSSFKSDHDPMNRSKSWNCPRAENNYENLDGDKMGRLDKIKNAFSNVFGRFRK